MKQWPEYRAAYLAASRYFIVWYFDGSIIWMSSIWIPKLCDQCNCNSEGFFSTVIKSLLVLYGKDFVRRAELILFKFLSKNKTTFLKYFLFKTTIETCAIVIKIKIVRAHLFMKNIYYDSLPKLQKNEKFNKQLNRSW